MGQILRWALLLLLLLGREGLVEFLLAWVAGPIRPDHRLLLRDALVR